MARKTTIVRITAEGRDLGKWFFLEEMPSTDAARWARRIVSGLAKSGMQLTDDIVRQGVAGIASIGLSVLAGLDPETADELLDNQLMACVKIIPDPAAKPDIMRKIMTDDDIEEVATRFKLQMEVFSLHTGFSWAEFRSMLSSAMTSAASPNTPTSPPSSGP